MFKRDAAPGPEIFPNTGGAVDDAANADQTPLRIAFLTEDEPLFTADAFREFFREIGCEADTVLVVMTDFAPSGTQQGQWTLMRQFWQGFGMATLLKVAMSYLFCRLNPAKRTPLLLRRHGVRLLRTSKAINSDFVLGEIRRMRPDIIVSASMNSLFKPALLRIAPCFNLHLSLLPRHKGLMPVFWALHDGDRETGATVFRVNEDIDGGEILVQRRVAIGERRLIPLYGRLKLIGMAAMAEAIRSFSAGKDCQSVEAPAALFRPRRKPGIEQMRGFVAAGNCVI